MAMGLAAYGAYRQFFDSPEDLTGSIVETVEGSLEGLFSPETYETLKGNLHEYLDSALPHLSPGRGVNALFNDVSQIIHDTLGSIDYTADQGAKIASSLHPALGQIGLCLGATVGLGETTLTMLKGQKLTIKRNKKGRISGVEQTQRHHVLHQKLRSHPLWEKAGMSVEDGINKMFLPTEKGAKLSSTRRSIHQGRHVQEIESSLRESMTRVHEQGQQHDYTKAQYRAKLMKIIQKERTLLKSGKRALNKTNRPWADK